MGARGEDSERAGVFRQAPEGSRAPTRGAPTGATIALVMELVQGEDLSAHIARGPIPIAEALPIARQIAEALEAAHEQGIVHSDLQPANIKVRTDGTVKVFDFGLAKAMDAGGATDSDDVAISHVSRHMTEAGMIIDTSAYMWPEARLRARPSRRRGRRSTSAPTSGPSASCSTKC